MQSRASAVTRSARGRASRVETLACLCMLLFCTLSLTALGQDADVQTIRDFNATSTIAMLLQLGVFCLWLPYAIKTSRSLIRTTLRHHLLLALSLLAMLSCAWAPDAILTLRRALVLFATTLFGIYFGFRFTVSQQLKLLAFCCMVIIGVCFAASLFSPYGITNTLSMGAWKGAFAQKNQLGKMMSFSFAVFLCVRLRNSLKLLRWAGLGGSLALIVLSRSSTSVVIAAAMLLALPFFRMFRTRGIKMVPVVVALALALVAGGFVALNFSRDLFGIFGKDATLTGRTSIWTAVTIAVLRKPWLGYGFKGFWNGASGGASEIMASVRWTTPNSHNGYLDLLLDLGVAGLLLYGAGFLFACKRAAGGLRTVRSREGHWHALLLLFLLLANLTESTILLPANIYWIAYVSTLVALARRPLKYSAHRPAASRLLKAPPSSLPLGPVHLPSYVPFPVTAIALEGQ